MRALVSLIKTAHVTDSSWAVFVYRYIPIKYTRFHNVRSWKSPMKGKELVANSSASHDPSDDERKGVMEVCGIETKVLDREEVSQLDQEVECLQGQGAAHQLGRAADSPQDQAVGCPLDLVGAYRLDLEAGYRPGPEEVFPLGQVEAFQRDPGEVFRPVREVECRPVQLRT